MPIYEYRRPDGSTFELMQSFADDALTHDPETGVEVQRVLHAPAVHFKGKGFYNTDYGTRKRQRETAASAAEGSSAEGSTSGSEDKGSSNGKGADGKQAGAEGKSSGAESKSKSSEKSSTASSKSEPVGAKS